MSAFQTHLSPPPSQQGELALPVTAEGLQQAQSRFAAWGKSHPAESFLASPGENKQWSAKAKTNGKVKNALSRAAAEAWSELIEDYPLPEGLLGRLSRTSTPFIKKELEENASIVKASMNTVFLSYLYIEEFKRFSLDVTAPPGKLVTAAAENAFRLLCEGKAWTRIKEAMLSAARAGDYRVDVHYTRLVAAHPGARTTYGGGGVLDRLAAASASAATAAVSVGAQVPGWAPSEPANPAIAWPSAGKELGR